MITLTQLEYIVAVDKHGNFRQAAKACHVTQPTLSMQIQKLEDDLGVIIFDRSQQPIRTTLIGTQIVNQSRIALSETKRISTIISTTKTTIEGDLRLGVIPTMAPYVLPLFLDRFVANYPKVKLQIEESKTDDILVALQRDQLDVGLLATPLHEATIREIPLFDEAFYVYVAKEHPLSTLDTIQDSDLKNESILLLSEGHCLREQIVRICRFRNTKAQAPTGFEFTSGSIETLCRLVERGHGYTVIPHLAKNRSTNTSGRVIPFAAPQPSRQVSLVVHQSYPREAILRALADTIQASLPAELQKTIKSGTRTIPFR